MFILANGAFKSGSTWLVTILEATGHFSRLPETYAINIKGRNWLDNDRIKSFLESGLYRDTDYFSKGHYFDPRRRDLFLSYEGVYVFNIKRDLKDSLVSHYYHLIRQNKLGEELASPERLKKGFSDYYWRLGRYKAQQLMIYHEVWDVPSAQIYTSSFERLKTDYEAEVQRIGHFIGLDLSLKEIAELKEKTSIQTLQKNKGLDKLPEHKRFLRKGLIGEWQNYFDDDALEDVAKIEARGLGKIDMLKYHALFRVLDFRRRLVNH